jgi:putative beta-lysine N-acetyltransferase
MSEGQTKELFRRLEVSGDDWYALLEEDGINERIKLKKYRFNGRPGLGALGEHLMTFARDQGLGKIITEVREADFEQFLGRGFTPEGMIPGYFQGEVAYVLSYFTDPNRQASTKLDRENEILEAVLAAPQQGSSEVSDRFTLGPATIDDVTELAAVYETVFTTFPTPLHEPAFVAHLMESREGIFHVARQGNRIVSAAAAEVDWADRHAEMTNCATLPDFRGQGLMAALLHGLEPTMADESIGCLYSLARASSFGMNLVLRRLGYKFRGRLINNSHIMGDYEDMNIWVKA